MNNEEFVMLVSFAGINGQHQFVFASENEAEECAYNAIKDGVFARNIPNGPKIIVNSQNAMFIIMSKNQFEQQIRMAQIAQGGAPGPRIVRS